MLIMFLNILNDIFRKIINNFDFSKISDIKIKKKSEIPKKIRNSKNKNAILFCVECISAT